MSDRLNLNESPMPLALRLRDAARLTGLSERALWARTAPRGPIPVARIGAARLYLVGDLQEWLAREAAKSLGAAGGAA